MSTAPSRTSEVSPPVNDAASGEDKKKGAISRVNRACRNCRRMKMRCVGGDDPPCERCAHAKLECVMEQRSKPSEDNQGSARLQFLEDQVVNINQTLSDLVSIFQSRSSQMPPDERLTFRDNQDRPQADTSGPLGPSLPPSRAISEDPDGLMDGDDISRPLEAMSNMAELVEAAMERSKEEKPNARPPKRARFASPPPSGPTIVEPHHPLSPLHSSKRQAERQFVHVHAYPDAVALGLVPEEEGRILMQTYFSGCHDFMPCYDPRYDTWEALRSRSPFSLTTIIMVGARVRDGGKPASEVQMACRVHAQKIAKGTLFADVTRIEAIQAMILLATFSDRGWLPGGHAIRMGLDMGLDLAFGRLLRSGMGLGKNINELESERILVVRARVWFCLYLFEHQIAYGNGRRALLPEDMSIMQCRRFLEHPLSIPSDVRLVSMVELAALRSPLYSEALTLAGPHRSLLLDSLKHANNTFATWETEWSEILTSRQGDNRFLHESLVIQRQYAELFANSQLLRNIQTASDIHQLSADEQFFARCSLQNAQKCLDICLRNENYRQHMKYAVHFTHVSAAFAASFLLRALRLFPDDLDQNRVFADVAELAQLLSEVPAGRYARSIKILLRRAKRRLAPTFVDPTLLTLSPPVSNSSGGIFDTYKTDMDGVPLFLDDQSLGAPVSKDPPYAGLENYFLPLDLDQQLFDLQQTRATDENLWW